jgi:hypothetical protein
VTLHGESEICRYVSAVHVADYGRILSFQNHQEQSVTLSQMFQSVAATPALITPPSRRLNRRPLGRRSTQVSSVHFQVSHPVYALALSLGGGATQLFRGSHTRAHDAPIATPQSFRPREADTRVTAGQGRPGNTIHPTQETPRGKLKIRDHRPSRTTHTKDGTTIGLQATGPCGAPAARAGSRRVAGTVPRRYFVSSRPLLDRHESSHALAQPAHV